MINKCLILICLSLFPLVAEAQEVRISIVSPPQLNNRKAVLLTREKGFAAVVHSIQLGFDTTHLKMNENLLPELYQLQVSKLKGSLTFFFESGTKILLDTVNIADSKVLNSVSNREWVQYRDSIQKPSDARLGHYVLMEGRAKKQARKDSVTYWLEQQANERDALLGKTASFIRTNPHSFVSLYLLKNYWYAFKKLGLFELLHPALAQHSNYVFLRAKKKENTSAN